MRSKKTLVATLSAIALVAIAGIAYAFWTGSGSGSGSGTAGTSATVTLTGTVAAGIAPGTSRAVTFTAANPDDSPIRVTTVHLESIAVDAEHAACATADFTMADVTENHQVPAGATAEALPVNGSLVYANTAVNQDACQGATLPGDANTAVRFNGSTQYANAVRQLGGNFSFDFWVKSTQSYANNATCAQWWMGAALIDTIVAGQGDDFGISMCLGKIMAGAGSPDVSIASAATYNDGNWHHVVFTRTQTSGAMALYVDGSPVGTATGSTDALDSAANLSFARSHSGQWYFAGTLDEIALYNTVLSGATVTAHYNAR